MQHNIDHPLKYFYLQIFIMFFSWLDYLDLGINLSIFLCLFLKQNKYKIFQRTIKIFFSRSYREKLKIKILSKSKLTNLLYCNYLTNPVIYFRVLYRLYHNQNRSLILYFILQNSLLICIKSFKYFNIFIHLPLVKEIIQKFWIFLNYLYYYKKELKYLAKHFMDHHNFLIFWK